MKSRSQPRAIDIAMQDMREDKEIVRDLWIKDIKEEDASYRDDDDTPLYLTLCGANGTDIILLSQAEVISLEKNGAISTAHVKKVVAIENNKQATLRLQKMISGLKILEKDVKSLLRGDSLTKFPDKEESTFLSARVINLDFNAPLIIENRDGEFGYPQVGWIQKIATIQRQSGNTYWKLYLTLNSSAIWQHDELSDILDFLKDNMESNLNFAMLLAKHAPELSEYVLNRNGDISSNTTLCQHLMMVFVPKKIASVLSGLGYIVSTQHNICYGGSNGSAPMVTWIIKCERSSLSSNTARIYNDSLNRIFSDFSNIEEKRAQ